MARHPCHSTAALAGGQAWRDGRGRQASSRVLRVSRRRGQHRLSGQAAHPLSQPCPMGTEIMGGVQGKWPAWPGGGAGLGIWAMPGERHSPPQNPCPPVWGCCLPPPHLPLLSQRQSSHSHCWPTSCSAEAWAPTTQQHPCGQSELFITGVPHPSPTPICVVCGTHTDVHMHRHTYIHLLTPKGPDKHLVERM